MSQAEPAPTPGGDEAGAWLNAQRHELVCRVELSASYHEKRERYFLTCERLSQAFAALTATAAFSQLLPSQAPASGVSVGAWFALAAAVASIFPLVFAYSARASKHALLAADHKRLLAEISAAGFELDMSQLATYRAKLHLLEAGERASLGALVVLCQNEMAAARGEHASIVRLKLHQRLTMHVFDWDIQPPAPKR